MNKVTRTQGPSGPTGTVGEAGAASGAGARWPGETGRRRVFVVMAKRTPIAPKNGIFKDIPFFDLAACAVQALLTDHSDARVLSLIAGNALGAGGNPARLMALAAGLPAGMPAMTIDTQCCSGLDAIGVAYERLMAAPSCPEGLVLAGGAESSSTAPVRVDRQSQLPYEEASFTPWPERDPSMLDAAMDLERSRGISQQAMLSWVTRSHQAIGQTRDTIAVFKGQTHDRLPPNLTPPLIRRASTFRPYNPLLMAPLADGAAFVALSTKPERHPGQQQAQQIPLEILSFGQAGADPALPGLSCAALGNWLTDCERRFDFDRRTILVSLMESFVSQVLANIEDLGLEADRVNPWGGLLTRGHPVGASGAVLVCDLFDQLGPGEMGLALIPAAGGLASGLLVRRLTTQDPRL